MFNDHIRRSIYLWIALVAFGCAGDGIGFTETFECEEGNFDCSVDAVLASYVNDFFTEAESRGRKFPKDNLVVTFADAIVIDGVGYSGRGWWDYNGTGQKRVEILKNAWGTLNDSEREILMFHELGHAMLERGHRNSRFSNCDRASIMCGDICDGFYLAYVLTHDERRTYYIDELFDPCVEPPSWSETSLPASTSSVIFLTDTIGVENENWVPFLGENAEAGISDSVASSGKYSLVIVAGEQETTHSSVLQYEIRDIPGGASGATFKVKVKVKTEDVVGKWAMSLQARNASDRLVFNENTLACQTLDGTTDFQVFELYHHCFEDNIESISLNIGFTGGTTGTMYIDDLQFLYQK